MKNMKNAIKRNLALCLALMLIMGCTFSAAAAKAPSPGLTGLSVAEGYELMPMDDVDAAIEATDGVYYGVEQLGLNFPTMAGEQYMVFLLHGQTVPTESSIRYINQLSGSGENMEINIFPDSLRAAGSYYIYISDSASYKQVASFTVTEPPYTVGDVDGSGEVDAADATRLLRHLAELALADETVVLPAADTDGDGKVDIGDVTKLLRVLAEIEYF